MDHSKNTNKSINDAESHETIKRKIPGDNTMGTKLYTMCQLNFYLVEGEGIILNDNMIEVRLLIDNHSDFDWPENLHVKGKDDCKVTRGFDYIIPQKVKSCSVKGVKFTLSCPVSVLKLEDEVAVFELYALDEQTNKKYFSDDIKVALKYKKTYSLFNLCNSFIK